MSQFELVDVVDDNDSVTESRSLEDCLLLGLLHRSVTVFLRNSLGYIFLQQRSFRDEWLPGKWTASCTGHVKSGEDVSSAATRELEEELGIKANPCFLFKFRVPTIKFNGMTEREWSIVFEVVSDDQVRIDSTEIVQGKFMPIIECKRFFDSKPNDVCFDARLAFEKYLAR